MNLIKTLFCFYLGHKIKENLGLKVCVRCGEDSTFTI